MGDSERLVWGKAGREQIMFGKEKLLEKDQYNVKRKNSKKAMRNNRMMPQML